MKISGNENGYVLITALLIMVVLTIIGIAATNTSIFELQIAGNDRTHKNTLYQAEAGAILSTEVLTQNIISITGFEANDPPTDSVDITANIRVWDRTSNDRNGLAFYLDPLPWTTDRCTPTDPSGPNISYPISNIASGVELSDIYIGGHIEKLPGGSLVMAAGYERTGKSAVQGTARLYDIISRHRGLNNSESTVVHGWRHIENQ